MKYQSLFFLEKYEEKKMKMSTAEFAQRVVKVNKRQICSQEKTKETRTQGYIVIKGSE